MTALRVGTVELTFCEVRSSVVIGYHKVGPKFDTIGPAGMRPRGDFRRTNTDDT
jgi:hypothetical protein